MAWEPSELGGWITAGVATLAGALLAIRQGLSKWKGFSSSERADDAKVKGLESSAELQGAGTVAMTALYDVLTREVGRLAEVNTRLSKELTFLHGEIVDLRKENLDLRDEVGKLTDQLGRLEVIYLECTTCPTNRARIAELTDIEVSNCVSRQAQAIRERQARQQDRRAPHPDPEPGVF